MGKVPDIIPISDWNDGTQGLIGARLCNFVTGSAVLLGTHTSWLSSHLSSFFTEYPNACVDIFGYASKKGTSTGYDNQGLSERRRDAVKFQIHDKVSPSTSFLVQSAYGSSHSTGRSDNDDGYWRAVDVCVFASAPPGRKAEPHDRVSRLVFRETLEIRKTYKSGDDDSQSEHFGMLSQGQAIAKDVYRIKMHPCEQGDPDNGDVKASRTERIPRDYVLTGCKIARIMQHHSESVFLTWVYTTTITRRYTFEWGADVHGKKVKVERTNITDGNVGPLDTYAVDQPPNYLDP